MKPHPAMRPGVGALETFVESVERAARIMRRLGFAYRDATLAQRRELLAAKRKRKRRHQRTGRGYR